MITYIYLIENIEPGTNKVYIGKTKESYRNNRKNHHRWKWGKQILFTCIDQIDSLEQKYWKPLESYWIEHFKQKGFEVINKNKGGGGPGYLTDEQKYKITNHVDRKTKIKNNKERAVKISIALTGRKKSQEHKDKIKNRIISQNHISNIRKAKCKSIIQYDKQGNYINKFNSLKEASDVLKINYQNLSQHVREYKGCNKTIGGYVFKYAKIL